SPAGDGRPTQESIPGLLGENPLKRVRETWSGYRRSGSRRLRRRRFHPARAHAPAGYGQHQCSGASEFEARPLGEREPAQGERAVTQELQGEATRPEQDQVEAEQVARARQAVPDREQEREQRGGGEGGVELGWVAPGAVLEDGPGQTGRA